MARRLVLAFALSILGVMVYHPPGVSAANGALNPTGNCTVDTTALTMACPSGTFSGTLTNGIAVFEFSSVTIGAGITVSASGANPFELLSDSTATINGTVSGDGQSVTSNFSGAAGEPGGPGGYAGGSGATSDCPSPAGAGPGGGGGANCFAGAGGGGFGGAGAAGASGNGYTGGAGGATYGNLATQLQGGSGGGGADGTPGGGGGGAVEIAASSGLTIAAGAAVTANGGNGGVGGEGGSGGGSGGGVILDSPTVSVAGTVSANGGQGGAGGCCGDAGGGGGGRILIQASTRNVSGTLSVSGGTSGTAGGYPHGVLSPDVTGFTGTISYGPYVPQGGVPPTTACKNYVCPSAQARFNLSGVAATFKVTEGTNGVLTGNLQYSDSTNPAATIPGCYTGSTACNFVVSSFTCSGSTAQVYGTVTVNGTTRQVHITLSGTGSTTGSFTMQESWTGGSETRTVTGYGIVAVNCP